MHLAQIGIGPVFARWRSIASVYASQAPRHKGLAGAPLSAAIARVPSCERDTPRLAELRGCPPVRDYP